MISVAKKLVIVGDKCVGKTSIVLSFLAGESHRNQSLPRVCDPATKDIEVCGKSIELSLWDTRGSADDSDRQRPLNYPGTDVVLICFSIDQPSSLKNIRKEWSSEMKHFCPDVPIILVGNKTDLRDDEETNISLSGRNEKPVQQGEGQAMAREIGALRYLECSAKTMEGIEQVFETATIAALINRKQQKKKGCVVL